MFNFAGITHIIKNPAGSYSLVGSVPGAAAGRPYKTVNEALFAVVDAGGKMCESATCACNAILRGEQ